VGVALTFAVCAAASVLPTLPSGAQSIARATAEPDLQPPLRDLAAAAGLRIGSILEPNQIADLDHAGTLAREFGSVTAENAMKWYAIQPTRGTFDFTGADAVLDFADANDMTMRGHALVWAQDQFTPAWVTAITDPAELRAVIEDHLREVLDRYRGRIVRWDVVNEPLATLGTGPSDNVFRRVLGPGWLEEIFRLAHEIDPDVELWLNEYGSDWVPGKHAALLELVRSMVDDGVPIHGIGLQTHRLSPDGPDPATFERQLGQFAELGLAVAITEVDVATDPGLPTEVTFAAQAEAYRRVVAGCLAVPACEEVTTWGISDADTWLDGQGILPAPTRPLLFDGDFRPKPAYDAVAAALAVGRPVAEVPTTTTEPASEPIVPTSPIAPLPAVPVLAGPTYTG
jgi:endo-1,4-beta-xylanase